jgi:26S proteasome regulatory subunit N7
VPALEPEPANAPTQVSEFIVAGRLAAKIDKEAAVVETVPAFERHANYKQLIKEGDLLLNRIQKLSKVVDVE